ncbi:hypothetical protein AMATHDRAFT_76771 [Amanita thiersii Skay4041]|uniref:NADAR domain-containing protein n=1 Tax=Amanita thiersii Skay4041 TaxID=703135 RepID=A0A2A9NCN2_9AGAR|nr:hypothetical protein AMATHDRAFT_76771 [Amanita thiersii Skay4041]
MQSRKTITIVTSPSSTTSSLPLAGSDGYLSPTVTTSKKAPVQYRIEERTRTIYVTSDVSPTQWDTQSITEFLKVTELSDTDKSDNSPLSVGRSKSQSDTIVTYIPDSAPPVQENKDMFPSRTHRQSRRLDVKPAPALKVNSSYTPPESPIWRMPATPIERPRILFYHKHDPYYGFTNFSAHPVLYRGKKYPTSEHLFQSMKFHDHKSGLAEHIRTCSERPSVAFSEARRFQPEIRSDWLKINIQKMEEVLWLKFTQHSDLKAELLATGNAELIEDSDKDAFWGIGADRRGRNELGKALERLRAKLREA